ncbi:hypothetical protein BH23ACT4_BH23ACT4_06260 [soil metagenome]
MEDDLVRRCMELAGTSLDDIGPMPEGRIPNDSEWSDPLLQATYFRCLEDTGLAEIDGDDPEEVEAANHIALTMKTCLEGRGWTVPELETHPIWGYLLPNLPPPPSDVSEQQALNRDVASCASEAGIPVEGAPES